MITVFKKTSPLKTRGICLSSAGSLIFFTIILVLAGHGPLGRAQEYPVIPPGQESLLQETLVPPAGFLPDGSECDSVQIGRHELALTFTRGGEEVGLVTVLPVLPGEICRSGCTRAGELCLCPEEGDAARLLPGYAAWLAKDDRSRRAAGAWSEVARPETLGRDDGEIAVSLYIFVPLWLLCLVLGFLAAKRFLSAERAQEAVKLLIGFGVAGLLFVSVLFLLKPEPDPFVTVAWLILAALAGVFTIRRVAEEPVSPVTRWMLVLAVLGLAVLAVLSAVCLSYTAPPWWSVLLPFLPLPVLMWAAQRRSAWRLERAWWRGLLGSGLPWFALLVLLPLAYLGGLMSPVQGVLEPLLMGLSGAWIEDDVLRAVIADLAFFSLFAATIVTASAAALRSRRGAFRALLLSAGIGAAAAALPASVLFKSLYGFNPDTVWQEWQAAVWLLQGRLPHINSYPLGGQVLASLVFHIFGVNAFSLNLFKFAVFLFFGASLAMTARLLHRELLAAVFTAAAFALFPTAPFLALEGWWFLLAGALIALSAAALVSAARGGSGLLLLLGLLLAQCAVETRLEAVVLFPLFYLIQAAYGFPHRKWWKWINLLFAFNILRVLLIAVAVSQFGDGHLSDNASGYATLLSYAPAWLAAGLLTLILAGKDRLRPLSILVLWMLGAWALYLFVYTAPSHREAVLIAAPLFLLAGGMTSGPWLSERRLDIGIRCAAAVLCVTVMMVLAWPFRVELARWGAGKTDQGRAVLRLAEGIPPDVPLVLDPTYLAFAMPERMIVRKNYRQATSGDMIVTLEKYPLVACFNDGGRDDECCFYEIQSREQDDKYTKGRCWPVSAIRRKVEEVRGEGDIRMLLLGRPDPAGEGG